MAEVAFSGFGYQAPKETDFPKRMDTLLEAERLLIEEDAGCAPRFFEGEVRPTEPFIKNFVYQPYGGSLDVKLWRIAR